MAELPVLANAVCWLNAEKISATAYRMARVTSPAIWVPVSIDL
jgi:hypothetical protein